ncbi:hypothetical protein D3C73_1555500 [compost metagenome]
MFDSSSIVNSACSQPKVCSNTGVDRNEPGFPHSADIMFVRCSRKFGLVILKILRVASVERVNDCSTSVEKYLVISVVHQLYFS